jgi:hypothetical protein
MMFLFKLYLGSVATFFHRTECVNFMHLFWIFHQCINITVSEISGSHGGKYEDISLQECVTMYFYESN